MEGLDLLDPKKRDGLSNGDARFLEIIDKYGWHVMSVAPLVGEKGQSFAYSTGLFRIAVFLAGQERAFSLGQQMSSRRCQQSMLFLQPPSLVCTGQVPHPAVFRVRV
jgi:hypothetical protein